jgi:hypothetical protein
LTANGIFDYPFRCMGYGTECFSINPLSPLVVGGYPRADVIFRWKEFPIDDQFLRLLSLVEDIVGELVINALNPQPAPHID